jgi:hypothetical protein
LDAVMLTQAYLLPNVPHELRFEQDDSNIRLLDETGENTLLFAGLKYDSSDIVLNDFMNGEWGEEVRLSHPSVGDSDHGKLWIKFTGTRLEVWTRTFSYTFVRFDKLRMQSVRFMKTYHSHNTGDSLRLRVLSPEAMALEIDHRIFHERLSQLEQILHAQLPVAKVAE